MAITITSEPGAGVSKGTPLRRMQSHRPVNMEEASGTTVVSKEARGDRVLSRQSI